ncbi:transmembrane proteins 14C-domain-containing protein [Dactylonectria macrodidyma]|uniref:Transmembrane proteins 14C-domain-containing protein n=1 Tax=Dactylonectria macrodidyma TaxID=307937 RepID=A0A9P9FNN3_9HYPO|nr:transmembrane proteins 14C-domain-containing protein [Dactylonectria macrodidyma]
MADPSTLQMIGYVLGALTASGGTMGYVKTGSLPSIIAGCGVGFLYTLGAYRIQTQQSYGVELCLLASVVLAGSAFPRAIRLRKPVPIVLSVISSIGLFTFGTALRRRA